MSNGPPSEELRIMRGVVFGLAISVAFWIILIGGGYVIYRATQ